MAVLRAGAATGAGPGPLPKDACALLELAEIQTLAPSAKIGSGIADASTLPIGVSCMYTWGPRTHDWGESELIITVMDAAKAWPGKSAEDLRQGLLAKVKVEGKNAAVIPGVGDTAAFTFEERSSTATAEALLPAKGVLLALNFHAGDALAIKDKIVALLKDAAARL
jgi:hypothetical protein